MSKRMEENYPFYAEHKWVKPFIQSLKSWKKFWWVFLLAGLISSSLGFLYASGKKTKYKSRLTFAMEEGKSNIGSLYSLASQFGISMGNESGMFSGDNIIPILKSRRIIESVLTSTDTFQNTSRTLIDYYLEISRSSQKNGQSSKVTFLPGQPRNSYSKQQDSLLYKVYKEFSERLISVDRPDKRLSIYEIRIVTPDEKLTHDFTKRILDSTNKFYTGIRTRKNLQTLNILQERLAAMQGNLNESIREKADVQDRNLNPAFSNADVPVLKQQMNIQTFGAAYAELFKNTELARFQYLNNFPLIQVIDDVRYPMQKLGRGRLKMAFIWGVASVFLVFFILWIQRVISVVSKKNMVTPSRNNNAS